MIKADIDVPKNQAKPRLASLFLLPLHLWLPSVVFPYSDQGHSPYTTTTGSRTGVDLEVVFFVGFQNTLLESHARFLDLMEDMCHNDKKI